MAVLADRDRVGAQYELERLGIRHLAIVEYMPPRARVAAGFAAFQFDAQEIDAGFFLQRAGVVGPLNIFFLVDVPVVAFAADQSLLPSIRRPGGRIRSGCRRIGIRKPNARSAGRGTVWILASYDGLQIHKKICLRGLAILAQAED